MTIPDYLFSHLEELAARQGTEDARHGAEDVTMQFQDGSVKMDLILLAAASRLVSNFGCDCESFIVESNVRTGRHLRDLLYTGETCFENNEDKLNITQLIEMLDINIDILLEDACVGSEKEEIICPETVEIIVAETPDEPDVNRIIMANMNQNDNNIIITQDEEVLLPTLQKSPPKDRNKKVFICDFHPCVVKKLSFEGISKFKRHTHSAHAAKPLACPENQNGCTFRADDFSKLGNHVQGVHKDIYSENVVCEECHKAFPSQSYLKTHMQRMHKVGVAERGKICPYCGETKLQLNDHIMRAHKTQHFQCQYCPKKFKTSVQRRIHHNVHTGFKPYTCLNCDARFSRLHHRKAHLEKLGHTAGQVLKPDDHVDERSARVGGRLRRRATLEVEELQEQTQEITQDIGVNCVQIIQNITLSHVDLEF